MAPRKCTQAWRAGEEARRGGHSPAGPRPGGPRGARGALAAGAGVPPRPLGLRPSLAPLLPPPIPRGAPCGRPRGGTRARAGLGAAPWGAPGLLGPPPGSRRGPAPFPAPRLQLPSGPPRRPLLPSRLARSGAGRPQGALALPKSGSWIPCPRFAREAAMPVGAPGGGPMCWNLQRLCSLREAKHFYTLKKKMFLPVAWISLGLFLKPCLGWELQVSRDGRAVSWGA